VSTPFAEPQIVSRLRAAGCVFAEDEARMLVAAARTPDELATLVDRRVSGLPLEHLVGWTAFCGLRIAVGPGVFVPRQRTEFLVREAAALAGPGAVVVDLCCGSGAAGVAIAALTSGSVELHAADVDPAAVRCARRNVEPAGGAVYEGDLYSPLPASLRGRITVLAANAPYVPTGAIALMPPEARLHEPRVALDGGADGLDVHRRVAAEAVAWVVPGGYVLVEAGERQAEESVAVFTEHGLAAHAVTSADLDATVVIARRPLA
jgi:release factor glutamine methyltransferase